MADKDIKFRSVDSFRLIESPLQTNLLVKINEQRRHIKGLQKANIKLRRRLSALENIVVQLT